MTRLNSQAVHDDCVRLQLRVFPHVGVNDDEDGKADGKADEGAGVDAGADAGVDAVSSLGVGERDGLLSRFLHWAWRQWSRPPTRALSPLLPVPTASPFRAFAWHRYQQRFAVAYNRGGAELVSVYDVALESWEATSLQHGYQHGIRCMEWQPLAGNTLAVGCASGLCVWRRSRSMYGAGGERLVGGAWMEMLREEGHYPVLSLSWAPGGRLLATAAPSQRQIIVWDVAAGASASTPLRWFDGGEATLVRWSPDDAGEYLFAASTDCSLRVWETSSWRCEKWDGLRAPVQTACWKPGGRIILFALAGSSLVYSMALRHHPPRIEGVVAMAADVAGLYEEPSQIARSYDDAAADRGALLRDEGPRRVGGERAAGGGGGALARSSGGNSQVRIWSMAWSNDRHGGERLVVTVRRRQHDGEGEGKGEGGGEGEGKGEGGRRGDDGGEGGGAASEEDMSSWEQQVAVFSVQQRPVLQLHPRGFIRGPDNGSAPHLPCFAAQTAFTKGALMSVCWTGGKISLFPFHF